MVPGINIGSGTLIFEENIARKFFKALFVYKRALLFSLFVVRVVSVVRVVRVRNIKNSKKNVLHRFPI